MSFPRTRPRRLRGSETLRRMVRETRLSRDDLVQPLFVVEGRGVREPISLMPGQHRFSFDQLVLECKELADLGVPAVILFGVPDEKDARGSQADAASGITQREIAAIKAQVSGLAVMTDVCLCEYTDHGHCAPLLPDGRVDNDATIELFARTAASQAEAGADMVAPSGLMDGQVGSIRRALDADGHHDAAILAYAAKTASAFYGPFRESSLRITARRLILVEYPNDYACISSDKASRNHPVLSRGALIARFDWV